MNEQLFRKSAIDEVSSPEKVDEYIKVSSVSTFVLLGAILLFVIALFVWGAIGHVTESATIQGVVFPFEGAQEVTLPHDGVVRELYVKRGDYVRSGQELALVSSESQFSVLSAQQSGMVLSFKPRSQSFSAYEPVVVLMRQDSARVGREIIAFTTFEYLRKLKRGMRVQVSPTDLPREKYGYIYGHIVDVDTYPSSAAEALTTLRLESFVSDVFPEKKATYAVRILLEEDADRPGVLRWSHTRSAGKQVNTGTFCQVRVVTKRQPIYKRMFEYIDHKVQEVGLWLE